MKVGDRVRVVVADDWRSVGKVGVLVEEEAGFLGGWFVEFEHPDKDGTYDMWFDEVDIELDKASVVGDLLKELNNEV